MHDSMQLKVPKWPFFLGDAFMLGLAYFICWQARLPLARWEIVACAVCVGLGALLGILPFLLEHRGVLKLIETSVVGSAAEKIQDLETIVGQISSAANLWENANQQADKTAVAAREISERMDSELRDFKEFLQNAQKNENTTLRLEVEKSRRAEGEWLQILVRILDHIFALYSAAERSGQQQLIAQLGQFQNACRDTARRIGLTPFIAKHTEPFDAKRHKWADGEKPGDGAVITEMLATGYTFQGKLLRPALVKVQEGGVSEAAPGTETDQNQLPLEPASS